MQILFFVLIGLSVGCLSGALGIGGGVLIIPALMYLFDFDLRKATATTLAVMVPPVTLPAAWHYYKVNQVDVATAFWVAAGFAVGTFLGAYLVSKHYLPESLLRVLFGLFLLHVATRFLISADKEVQRAAAGLMATLIAWLSFLVLRALGRRYPAPLSLAEQIRTPRDQSAGDSGYRI